jgi:hypothetical protein
MEKDSKKSEERDEGREKDDERQNVTENNYI